MGKKRIIQQSEEELLKEGEKVEAKTKKEVKGTAIKIKEGRVCIFSSYNNTIITLYNYFLWKFDNIFIEFNSRF